MVHGFAWRAIEDKAFPRNKFPFTGSNHLVAAATHGGADGIQ